MKENFIISVGEPWDFDGPDGENRIIGKIVSIVDNKCIIFESSHMLDFKGKSGRFLVLFPRCIDGNFNNIRSERIPVDGGLLLSEFKEGLNAEELENNSMYVLIGSVYRSSLL